MILKREEIVAPQNEPKKEVKKPFKKEVTQFEIMLYLQHSIRGQNK